MSMEPSGWDTKKYCEDIMALRSRYDEIERITGKKVIVHWDPRLGPIPECYILLPGIL